MATQYLQKRFKFENMKYILLLLLVAISFNSFGQKIDGIGKIKLGNSYEQIISDLGIKPKEVIKGKKLDKVSYLDLSNRLYIYLLQFDTTKKYNDGTELFYIKCSNTSKLIFPTINISGIEINNIDLSFYNNNLYMLYIENPSMKFIEAFKIKYGEGKSNYKSNKVTCTSTFKDKYDETEYTNEITWTPEFDSIQVKYYYRNYRDGNCEKSIISYFEIKKKDTYHKVLDSEVKYHNRQKEIEKERLKNQTKDL
jgi:hypothetical protein